MKPLFDAKFNEDSGQVVTTINDITTMNDAAATIRAMSMLIRNIAIGVDKGYEDVLDMFNEEMHLLDEESKNILA